MFRPFSRTSLARAARGASALVLAASLVGTAACGKDKNSTGSGNNGTYTLRTANGHNVPYELTVGTVNDPAGWGKVKFNSGSITLKSNGQYTSTGSVTLTLCTGTTCQAPQTFSEPDNGTFTISGNTLTTTSADGEVSTATIGSNTITLTETDDEFGTITLVFRK